VCHSCESRSPGFMLDPRFRGDDKCTEHPSVTEALHYQADLVVRKY